MSLRSTTLLVSALVLGGCSGTSGLPSTGSIFGGGADAAKTAAPAPSPNGDPTTRALQVGSTSARAIKCGYNFDPAKLKTSYLSYEMAQQGGSVADAARIEQVYDVAFRGVTKAAATEPKYCNPTRTKEIKEALTRHLAGDYAPGPPKKVAKQETGLFGFGGGGSSEEGGRIGPSP